MKNIKIIGLLNILLLAASSVLPLHAQTKQTSASDLIVDSRSQLEPSNPNNRPPKRSNKINYLGIGGTIGLSDEGDTALGDGGFSILGRVSLTENFSIHTSSVIKDDNLLSVAATGGIPIENKQTGRTIIFPFVGGGISADTEDFNVDPVVTGGVDIPINPLITGTMRVNANFGDETDIGLILGVGVDLLKLF